KKYLNSRYEKSDFNSNFLNLIYEISNGLPSRFLQYIDVLEEQGFIYKRDGIWYNTENLKKDNIHNLVVDHSTIKRIHEEVKDFSDSRIELLKFAALIEDSFDHELMCIITGRSKVTVLRDLQYLKNQKFLSGNEEELYDLKHETIRVAIFRLMDEGEIKKRHKLIADAVLENRKLPERTKTFLLAKHYHASDQQESAYKYLTIAGNIALHGLAFAEAREVFLRALSILDLKSVLLKTSPLIELLIKCAWVDRILGNYKDSLSHCIRAHGIIDKSNIELYSNLLLQNGLTYFRLQEWQKSVENFEECLKYESELSFFNSALACYGIASVHFELGNYKHSRRFFERALDDVIRAENKSFEADILNNLGALESVTGNSLKAVARFSDSIPIYESLNDDYGLAQVYNNLGLTYAEGRKWQDADVCYRKCLTICDKIGIIPLKSIVFLNRAYALIHLDDLATAEEYNSKAMRLVKKMNDQLGLAEYYKNLGVIKRMKSIWGEARNNFEKAIQLYQSLDNKLGYADTAYEFGLLSFDMDEPADFEDWFDKAIEGYMEIGLEQRVHHLEDERYQLMSNDHTPRSNLN
ncbi:MAG: tetratricopeptide repeat protein, partial [Calditrichaceae bacterium]